MRTEQKLMLDLVKNSIPAATALTVATEMEVLELIGIVKDPKLVALLNRLARLVPDGTPATLHNLINLLGHLMHMSDKATHDHRLMIDASLAALGAIPDVALTFGTFMSICEALLEAHHKQAANGA